MNFSSAPDAAGVIAKTTTVNTNGILGTWASTGSSAALSYVNNNGSNQIVTYTGGTNVSAVANLTDTTGAVNYNYSATSGTVQATFSANTIRYTAGAGTLAPGATAFTVNGLMNASSTGLWTIGTNPVTIGANKDLVVFATNQGIAISSIIKNNGGGTSSVTFSGQSSTSTLTLSGVNSGANTGFSGGLFINSGTVSGTTSLNALGTGTVTISSGATLNLGLTGNWANAISVAAGGAGGGSAAIIKSSADTAAASGQITLSNNLIMNMATNALTFSGGITGTGNVTVTGAASKTPTISGATLNFTGNLTNAMTGGTGALTISTTNVNIVGGIFNNNAGTGAMAVSSVLGATVTGVTQNSVGSTLTISGASPNFAGGVSIINGTLFAAAVGNSMGTGTTSLGSAATLSTGASLILQNSQTYINNIVTTANANGGVLSLGTGTTAGSILTGSITLNSPLRIFSSTATSGTLTLNGSVINGSGTGNNITIANASSTNTVFAGTNINPNGAIVNNGTSTGTVTISGAVGVLVTSISQSSSAGTLILSGTNSNFTGPINLTAGVLKLGSATALGSGGTLTISGGTTLDSTVANLALATTNPQIWNGSGFTFTGTQSLSLGGGNISFGTANNNYTITVGGSTLTENGAIADNNISSLTKAGAGTLVLAGSANYTGSTSVSAGTLTISGNLNGSTTLNVTGAAGSTLNLSGAISNPITITGITVNGGNTLSLASGTGTPLSGLTTLNLGAGSGITNLNLDLGTNSDLLTVSGVATTANTINFNLSAVTGFGAGTYHLLTATSGLDTAAYTFGTLPSGFAYSRSITASDVSLNVTDAPGTMFWNGGIDGKWNSLNSSLQTNWASDTSGTNANTLPSTATTVVFNTVGQTGPVSTTLEQGFTINKLVFNNQTNGGLVTGVTIVSGTGTNTLTIAPSSANDGIEIQTGAPPTITISAPLALGTAQTWTIVDSATTLSTAAISGAGALT